MFCENCGAELQVPNQSFCPKCGTPLRKKVIFKYNDKLNEYQDLKVEDNAQIRDLLDPDFVLLFVDQKRYRIWIWHGRNTTTRMKFIAAKLAPSIRDKYGVGFKISAVDEGNETLGFKIVAGLVEESDYTEAQTLPPHERTEEDLELLESLFKEKKQLLLKRVVIKKTSFLDLLGEETEQKQICKYCGSKLSEEQIICRICGKMVI